MPGRKQTSSSKLERVRALPWLALARGSMLVRQRWRALSAKERSRLGALLRASGGRPGRLTGKERSELRALLAKLDLGRLGAELAGLVKVSRSRGKRRRGRRSRQA